MDNLQVVPATQSRIEHFLSREQAQTTFDLLRNYLSASDEDLPGNERKLLAYLLDEAQATLEADG